MPLFYRILIIGIFVGAICLPLHARQIEKSRRIGPPKYEDLQNEVKASGALLVDVATGKVLYERNANNRYLPASTTKLMTALLVYERMGLNGAIVVMPEDTHVEPSNIPLRAGEKVTVSDMMHALLIASDNDCALALAHKVGGNEEKFVELMNLRAQQLGCTNTHFSNPNGLTDTTPQYTSAYDLLKIFQKVISFPELRRITQIKYFALQTRIGTKNLKNHNKLLGKYDGMGSAKTGWTVAAKHTYAASVIRDNREIQLILLHSPNKWNDARLLLDYGFANLPLIPSTPAIPPAPAMPSNTTLTVKDQSAPTQPVPAPQIPSPAAVVAATNAAQPSAPQEIATQTETKQPDPAPASPQKEKSEPVAKQTPKLVSYTIARGDTLAVISSRYNCEVKDILRHNRGLRSKRLRPGQTILIPATQ